MELNSLESAFDLQELLGAENEGTGSISRGVFAFRGAAQKENKTTIDCATPTKRKKESKKTLTKSPRKKASNCKFLMIKLKLESFNYFRLLPVHMRMTQEHSRDLRIM